MKRNLTFLLSLTLVAIGSAEVRLPSVITDGMVIQRKSPIPIWGVADPEEIVNIEFKGKNYSVKADESGNWEVILPEEKAGGPYSIKINDRVIEDVLVGDLYFCSGQSNMELPINRVTDMFAEEVDNYSNPMIREFKTPKEYSIEGVREDTEKAIWKKATGEETQAFGALVYFLAKELYENNGHVPVGIINSSWGGSKIHAWMSEKALNEYPAKLRNLEMMKDQTYRKRIADKESYAGRLWKKVMDENDPGYNSKMRWNDPEFDDGEWEVTVVPEGNWGKDEYGAINGSHWLRKKFMVPERRDKESAMLRLGCIVDADSVWINGKFVGFTSYQYPPRKYKIEKGILKPGENNVTIRVVSNSGVPHFVEEKPYYIVFEDGEKIALEGEWKHQTGSIMPPAPGVTDFFQTPTSLYNSMVYPFKRIPFQGVVWYQGESDVDQPQQYDRLLGGMIEDWRALFSSPDLDFYVVELADFLHPEDFVGRNAWQKLRDAQKRGVEMRKNAYLIKNSDTGEWNDIHPLDKKTPAKRIATKILK